MNPPLWSLFTKCLEVYMEVYMEVLKMYLEITSLKSVWKYLEVSGSIWKYLEVSEKDLKRIWKYIWKGSENISEKDLKRIWKYLKRIWKGSGSIWKYIWKGSEKDLKRIWKGSEKDLKRIWKGSEKDLKIYVEIIQLRISLWNYFFELIDCGSIWGKCLEVEVQPRWCHQRN